MFSLHRDTLAPDMLSTPFVGEDFGPHTRGVVMRKEVVQLLEQPESEWDLKPTRRSSTSCSRASRSTCR